jgi:hypothetical protein
MRSGSAALLVAIFADSPWGASQRMPIKQRVMSATARIASRFRYGRSNLSAIGDLHFQTIPLFVLLKLTYAQQRALRKQKIQPTRGSDRED